MTESTTAGTAAGTTAGTAVDTKAPLDLAGMPREISDMIAKLDGSASVGTASASLDIMRRIITADSEEAIFEAANAGTINGKSFAGIPFQIIDVEWKRSAATYVQEGAFPFYALLRVRDLSDGGEKVIDCGGFSFVSTVHALQEGGYLDKYMDGNDAALTITAKSMPSGYDVLLVSPFKQVKVR